LPLNLAFIVETRKFTFLVENASFDVLIDKIRPTVLL